MDLERYRILSGRPLPTEGTPKYEQLVAMLSAAQLYVNGVCDDRFTVPQPDGTVKLEFPPDVEVGIAILVNHMVTGSSQQGRVVASQSMEGMSQSFNIVTDAASSGAETYWIRYASRKKVKFIPLYDPRKDVRPWE